MIDAGTSVVLTGIVATGGKWVQDKTLDVKTVVGIGVVAVVIAVLNEANSKFAQQFAFLILLGAIFMYATPLGKAVTSSGTKPAGKTGLNSGQRAI